LFPGARVSANGGAETRGAVDYHRPGIRTKGHAEVARQAAIFIAALALLAVIAAAWSRTGAYVFSGVALVACVVALQLLRRGQS
jgi:hypothetical protein